MEQLPETTGIDDLAGLAMERMVEFLDYESRKTCRLVSHNFKLHVDGIGLSVRIDTRVAGIYKFCKSVTIEEAHIVHLKEFNLKEKQLKLWKTAILAGPIDSTWLVKGLLRKCSNLRVLIISGDCLVSQDFTVPLESQPIFNHLTQINLSLTSKGFSKAVQKVSRLLKMPITTLGTYKKMAARVQKNMTYWMRAIRSRVLKSFYASVQVNILRKGPNQKRKVYWEHEPLYEFFQYHRHTLEEVVVPSLLFGEADLDGKTYAMPLHLKLLCWNHGTEQRFETYWVNLLLAQNSLGKLEMNLLDIPRSQFLPLLNSVSSNNAQCLTHIQLTLTGEDLSLDIKIFQFCHLLDKFQIQTGSQIFIRNLNYLPRDRLTTLKFLGKVVGAADFDAVEFMQGFNPKSLILFEVSGDGPLNDPNYMLQFIKLVLRSRTLNGFSMKMNRDNLPPAWSLLTTHASDEFGFQDWFANLKAKEPKNHRCTELVIADILSLAKASETVQKLFKGFKHVKYVEADRAIDVDYSEVISRFGMAQDREQPFNIPRNANSYTVWVNQHTKAYKVLVNTKSYTSTVPDIQDRVGVSISIVMDGTNGNTEMRPLHWA